MKQYENYLTHARDSEVVPCCLFDTSQRIHYRQRVINFFCVPIGAEQVIELRDDAGQVFERRDFGKKTEGDTNLVMESQFPAPILYSFNAFTVEFLDLGADDAFDADLEEKNQYATLSIFIGDKRYVHVVDLNRLDPYEPESPIFDLRRTGELPIQIPVSRHFRAQIIWHRDLPKYVGGVRVRLNGWQQRPAHDSY